jgi:hypothetical protein
MNSSRKIAVSTGVVFIIATVTALLAAALMPDLTSVDYLTQVFANTNRVAAGALFYLIAAFTSAGIAISLYPVLKKTNPGLALGSVVFRALEAVMYMVAVASLLSVLTISQQITIARSAEHMSLQVISDSWVSVRNHATLLGVFSFCIGAFLYYYIFYQSRLIPRWLSGWGIIAIFLMLVACLLALFSGKPVTGYVSLVIPIAVQEMVLAVWLIIKGFNPSEISSEYIKADKLQD